MPSYTLQVNAGPTDAVGNPLVLPVNETWVVDATAPTADIIDFVLADFLANPDVNNWELTRDRIYERYQLNAAATGFRSGGFNPRPLNANQITAVLPETVTSYEVGAKLDLLDQLGRHVAREFTCATARGGLASVRPQ